MPDRQNDPLRKAKYLVRDGARPRFFAVSAVGYRRLFRVDYEEGNRFRLIDDNRPLSAPLSDYPARHGERPPPRSPVDALAIEVEQRCPNVWISLGSGGTAFNLYVTDDERGDAVAAGVYEAGKVWTDVKGLGPKHASRLAKALGARGVGLDTRKEWSWWRLAGRPFILGEGQAVDVAAAIAEAVSLSK